MSTTPFVDLKVQYLSIKEDIHSAIEEVFDRSYFILGGNVESFERDFASYCDSSYGVGVGSGTEAIHLSLVSCGVSYGDRVITVPNIAVPTVSAITFAGATPIFVDVDPQTYNMDPNRLEELLKKKSMLEGSRFKTIKAIIPVHLYGQAADIDPIMELAQAYNITVIEDACQAHGAEYKGKKVGSIGEMGCFSFYPTKNLGGYGDGGIIVTDNRELAEQLKQLRNYGQKDRYLSTIKGFNSRLDEIQAAILSVKLKYLDEWNKKRREKAKLYNDLLDNNRLEIPIEADYARHIYHLYVIRCKERDDLKRYLDANGVTTLIHYPVPIHLQEAYKTLNLKEGSFPTSERHCNTILSLPIYPELGDDRIKENCRLINGFSA